MGCLDDNTVVELVQQLLSGEQLSAVERHLDTCPSCRQLVARMAGDDGGDVQLSGESAVTPFSGRSLKPLDDLGLCAGRIIAGRYALERELGRGAMGSVWAAQDQRLRRRVAVKVLMRQRDKNSLTRFEREATAVARMRSAHIVEIYDYGVEEGLPFIVMEVLEGVSLRTLCKGEQRLPLGDVVDIVNQIADALTVAHANGIVHRDLKPANVFVCRDVRRRVVKVFDFGVAKTHGDLHLATDATAEGTLIGTPRYMSPEQVRGEANVDHRSDIWSLGVIAYELVCGQPPFAASNVGELVADILRTDLPRPSTVDPELPSEIDAFFDRALEKEPGKRFESAADLAHRLAAIATGERSSVTPRRLTPRRAARVVEPEHTLDATASTVHRARRAPKWRILAVTLVVIAGLVMAMWWPRPRAVVSATSAAAAPMAQAKRAPSPPATPVAAEPTPPRSATATMIAARPPTAVQRPTPAPSAPTVSVPPPAEPAPVPKPAPPEPLDPTANPF